MILAPNLALPHASKAFHLQIQVTKITAKCVELHILSSWNQRGVDQSRLSDPLSSGWSSSLRAVVATTVLVKETEKLTPCQHLRLTSPQAVDILLKGAPVPSRFSTENQDLLESILTMPYKCSLRHTH